MKLHREYNHLFQIANINLEIRSDSFINGLTYKIFDSFRKIKIKQDVLIEYKRVSRLETIFPENQNKKIKSKNNKYIEKSPASTSIFNFERNHLNVFYLKKIQNDLENSKFGPYLFAPFLCSFSAAMIHCSAIERKKKVALFLAPDEGGKTTAVKLAKEGKILSDDQNIIKKEGGNYLVYATPWGMKTNNLKGKVGGFFLIEKADSFKINPVHADVLLSYLWNEHLSYLFFLPRQYSQRHFNFLFTLSRSIPAYQIFFSKKFIDWNAIDKAMKT